MSESLRLLRFGRQLEHTVMSAEPVGPHLVKATIWHDGRFIETLIHDPDSMMGWTFLTADAATWRAYGMTRPPYVVESVVPL